MSLFRLESTGDGDRRELLRSAVVSQKMMNLPLVVPTSIDQGWFLCCRALEGQAEDAELVAATGKVRGVVEGRRLGQAEMHSTAFSSPGAGQAVGERCQVPASAGPQLPAGAEGRHPCLNLLLAALTLWVTPPGCSAPPEPSSHPAEVHQYIQTSLC